MLVGCEIVLQYREGVYIVFPKKKDSSLRAFSFLIVPLQPASLKFVRKVNKNLVGQEVWRSIPSRGEGGEGVIPSATPEVLKDPSRLPCMWVASSPITPTKKEDPTWVDKGYTGLLEDAKSLVNRCKVCQLTSRLQHKICWQSTPTFAKWSTPRTFSTYSYWLIAVDYFTKWVEAEALAKINIVGKMSSADMALRRPESPGTEHHLKATNSP